MIRRISATDARVGFGKLLQDVAEGGDTVLVERSGQPQAVVVSVDEYRRLQRLEEGGRDRWRALLDQAIQRVDHDLKGETLPPADEIIRDMRKERDARLLDLP